MNDDEPKGTEIIICGVPFRLKISGTATVTNPPPEPADGAPS